MMIFQQIKIWCSSTSNDKYEQFLLPKVFELVRFIVTKMNAFGNNESEETPLLIYNFIFYY